MIWFIGGRDEARMFILDDASSFGISLPPELLSLLKNGNRLKVLDARGLAEDLYIVTENTDRPVTVLGNGGALAITLLRRLGFDADYNFIGVERTYGKSRGGKAAINYEITERAEPNQRLLDDVVASGATVNYVIRELGMRPPQLMALLISGDTRGQFREDQGSTVRGVETVYAAKSMDWNGGYPALLSARFLLKKVRDDRGYAKYLGRYLDGREDEVREIVQSVDLGPFELLYSDPKAFIEAFGGQT